MEPQYFAEPQIILTEPWLRSTALEHHFGLYRQMSGSQYQISFCQILESERRLQLSSLLKVFDIKYGPGADVSLKEYLKGFSDDNKCYIDEITLDIEPDLTKLNEISLPEL